jgi:ketosteroid isomerase-like protein
VEATYEEADPVTTEERNKRTVLEFLDAFSTWDPVRYERYLSEEPYYRVAHEEYAGRAGFAAVARIGSRLCPEGIRERELESVVAEDNQVGVQLVVRARTNKGADYENLHAIAFELTDDGRIARRFEHLDTEYAAGMFEVATPRPPDVVGRTIERNKETAIAFFDAFCTWNPESYERYLTEHPTYRGGRGVFDGRDGFRTIAKVAAFIYPNGLDREIEAIFGEDNRVFMRLVVRATPNTGMPYENYYAMVFEFDDEGRIAKQCEYPDTAYASARFIYPTDLS